MARARDSGVASSLPSRLHSDSPLWSENAWEDGDSSDESPALQPRGETVKGEPATVFQRRATDPALPNGLYLEFMNIP